MSKQNLYCRGHFLCIVLLSTTAFATGCGSSDETSLEQPPSAAPDQAGTDLAAPIAEPATVSPMEPELASQTAATPSFTPPFPARLELFEPPKRAQSAVRREEESGGSVELKGFINVDEPRAILSIDGVIAPIPAGGEKYGVQVMSIDPPSVVLQRGRTRWTAKLE
jgi:hypothetical protein